MAVVKVTEDLVLEIWESELAEAPYIAQPTHPSGNPWVDAEQALAWGEAYANPVVSETEPVLITEEAPIEEPTAPVEETIP